MDIEIVKILSSYGCKYMEDDNKEMIEEIVNFVKKREEALLINGVSKRFSINEKVIWDGMYYWVLEINNEAIKVLLANDRNPDHPQYNDWWVNIDEVNAC